MFRMPQFRMSRFRWIVALTVALGLNACAAPPAITSGTPSAALNSPLTSPVAPPPTRAAGTGMVRGRLLVKGSPDRPVANVLLYLGSTVIDSDGKEKAVSLNRQSDPRTTTDQNGNFTFYNVRPGRYGLILDRVVATYMLNKPDQQGDLLIVVEADKEADFGPLLYDSLPE